MSHGGGGKLTQQLIEKMFVPAFQNPYLQQQHDGAVVSVQGTRLAMTTDSFVVKPLFFPGGDIGTLAVYGTVNDLAMCGARPLYLTAAFVIEEGFLMEDLWQIVQSMKMAAEKTGTHIVTGDTKVVDRGKGDGVFITTAGVGVIEHSLTIAPAFVKPGDCVLLSGDVGRHGIAVMSSREGLRFETEITSDCAPLWGAVQALLDADIEVHCLRDLTRGGLASALNEISQSAKLEIEIQEESIPVEAQVRGACEILGLDPLYTANEGRFAAFVPEEHASKALKILRENGHEPAVIGRVQSQSRGRVVVCNALGSSRILEMIMGDQLPRIC